MNAKEIQALSEEMKDLVFAYDTERGRFQYCMLRGIVTPLMMIGMGFLAYFTATMFGPMPGAGPWLTMVMEWAGIAGIVFAVITAPFLMGNSFQHLRASRNLAGILRAKGIDPSKLSSNSIWSALFEKNAQH